MLLLNFITALIACLLGLGVYEFLELGYDPIVNLALVFVTIAAGLTINDYVCEAVVNYFNEDGS